MKFWEWLKGKKTYIGGGLLLLAQTLRAGGNEEAAKVIEAVASVAVAIGLADLAKDKATGAR